MSLRHAVVCVALMCGVVQGDEIRGKVVGISDGDTITVLDANKAQHKVRLEGIDAPESSQAFGSRSKQQLSDKIGGKDVVVGWSKRDRYDRILGEVCLGERHVNLEMVQDGFAWHYKQFSTSKVLAEAEVEARNARKGLWADAKTIPPWEFRSQERAKKK